MKVNDLVIVALITATPPTIASVAALVVSIRTSEKVEVVSERVEIVHKATNSLTDRLVSVTRSDALQEGAANEKADEKDRREKAKK